MEIIGSLNDTLFSSFTTPGKSGDELLPKYRLANNMRSRKYDNFFIHISDLVNFIEEPELGSSAIEEKIEPKKIKNFVLIDDFVGTGSQAVKIWEDIEGFLVNVEEIFLLVIYAFDEGIKNIERETPMKVISNYCLPATRRLFSINNTHFSSEEKIWLKNYCEIAGSWPMGYGDCQSTVVFCHRIPNNTISILRAKTQNWTGLFSRY